MADTMTREAKSEWHWVWPYIDRALERSLEPEACTEQVILDKIATGWSVVLVVEVGHLPSRCRISHRILNLPGFCDHIFYIS